MNYNYNKQLDAANAVTENAVTLMLKSFFNPKSILINTPSFRIHRNNQGIQVTIRFFYYAERSSGISNIAPWNARVSRTVRDHSTVIPNESLKTLVSAITVMYEKALIGSKNTPINSALRAEVNLEMVRHYRPYMNAEILAHYLAINVSKYGFNRLANSVINAVPYINPDSGFQSISGVKIQLSGLLTSQRNRARKSVYTASAGTFHKSSENTLIDQNVQNLTVQYGSHTSKSQLGSFTVKVWLAG